MFLHCFPFLYSIFTLKNPNTRSIILDLWCKYHEKIYTFSFFFCTATSGSNGRCCFCFVNGSSLFCGWLLFLFVWLRFCYCCFCLGRFLFLFGLFCGCLCCFWPYCGLRLLLGFWVLCFCSVRNYGCLDIFLCVFSCE